MVYVVVGIGSRHDIDLQQKFTVRGSRRSMFQYSDDINIIHTYHAEYFTEQ